MPEKQKNAKKARAHKESKGSARGSKPIALTDLQKVLLVNGGMAHQYLRTNKERFRFSKPPKRRGGKALKQMVGEL